MAADRLNPYAREYYHSSLLPKITHPIHLPYDISSYNNILHFPPPPSISFNPTYFFASLDTTLAYSCRLPSPPNLNVLPADFSVGDCTTTQQTSPQPYCPKYCPNVNFNDMGLDYYHHWQQTGIQPPSLPLVSSYSYSSSPIMNQSRVSELNSTDEADYHQQQQAITVAAIASEYDDLVGNKKIIAEICEKEQPITTSLSPPYERGSSSRSSNSSRKIWKKGFNGYLKSRKMLIEFLDKHCQSENEKAKLSSTDKESLLTHLSAYDFVYLPIDFCTDANKGYAFVNFTNPTAAWKLNSFLNKYEWNVLNTKKIARVTYARRQGKEELVNYFDGTEFYCDSDELLPVCFVPYRDGSEKEMVKQSIVGKCIGYRKECYRHWCRCHSARNQKNV
ncbi:hypothetical protein C5167_010223 [Papaver somniferum]|uniref:Mei2-like C-terminal RNA recognition motif domain-containing protein n=1 Tax=Papaver somniferum TaxID=3469 RepID=A0A4Y7JZM6_PAPSO|nr:hypothetical protein C5167_010223 [Papaver somniferum]